jgi:hypothetical protein
MPSLATPPFAKPFNHSWTSCVTSTTRNELALPTVIPVAKGAAAGAGGEEIFSVDSLHVLVTGKMSMAPVGLVPGLRYNFSVALATFAAATVGGSDDCS